MKRSLTTGTSPKLGPRGLRRVAVHAAVSLLSVSVVIAPRFFFGELLAADNGPKAYALIFGTVWGPDNHPLYGIKIKIRRESDKKARWEVSSDHRGEFAQRVPAGKEDYVIWAELKGMNSPSGKPLHGDEVKVHIDNDERADVGVHLTEIRAGQLEGR